MGYGTIAVKIFLRCGKNTEFFQNSKEIRRACIQLSQTIKRLETELGTPLFVHMANKISLNEQGECFYKDISHILDSLEQAKAKVRDMEGSVSGEIKVLALANRRMVTQAIEKFSSRYPDVNFLLSHMENENIEKYDMIISCTPMTDSGYATCELLTEQLALAVCATHPLADAQHLDIGSMREQKFITMHNHSYIYNITQQICRNAGFVPTVSWQGQFSDSIVLKNLEGVYRTTYLSVKNDRYVTKAARLFADMLQTP